MKATQENRQANFESSLGSDVLLLSEMFAREQVSGLYEYQLSLVSEDENIDLYAIIGEHARVELELPGGGFRYFAGFVSEFTFASFRDNFAEYRVTLRPWFWLLSRASNNRIFQGKTVPEIIKAVCQEHGFTDLDDRLAGQHESRTYCVQYRETDFDFLSRLMEEEGIYYYFEHEADKHMMVLADGPSAHEPFGKYDVVPWYPPDADEHREREHLDDWSMRRGVRSGKFTLRDFDFTKPGADLEVVSRIAKPHAHAEFEKYAYPGGYSVVRDGETIARTRLEAEQADHEILAGRGNARGMIPGFLFTLELFPREDQNREYLVLEVTHRVRLGGYDTGGVDAGDAFEYDCSLTAMPSSEPYRPSRLTPRPVVHGPQTAIVVGKDGEEIWTDEYGRIKVQFHWDREGENDQDSSCWVRVSQTWAGKQWGAQFLPRIGHEVVVEFLEGDPDRPIVTGSVYNADNKPPYELPACQTRSGIKTRSTKSGTRDNFNEIRFEDKKGSEQLYIHAEKDMDTRVENCQTARVDVNRSVTVGNNEKHHVKNNREKTVDVDETAKIGQNRSTTVGMNDELQVGTERKKTVGVSETVNVGANRSATIGAADSVTAGANIDFVAGATINLTAGAAVNIKAGGLITLASPPGVVITHNDHQDLGLIKRHIDQIEERIATMEKDIKATSQSMVGTSMSQTGVGMANNGVSSSITQLSDSLTNLALGVKNINLETNVLSIKDASFHTIG